MYISSGKAYRYRYLAMLYIWVRRETARHTWVQEHDKERRKQWGLGQAVAPTTWGADWYYFGAADCWHHALYPCPCCILEVSVITDTEVYI